MSTYNKMQLAKALQYLRSRHKYIGDEGCKFKPTSAAATDIAKTFEAYRKEVLAQETTNNIRKFR